jgi:seryl-tRNA synthetase
MVLSTSTSLTRSFISCHRLYHTRILASRRKSFKSDLQCRNVATFATKEPDLDWKYLTDPLNLEEIRRNIQSRKGVGSIETVTDLYGKYTAAKLNPEKSQIWKKLIEEAKKIPNRSDPCVHSYGEDPQIVATPGVKPSRDFVPLQFHEIVKRLGLLRTDNLGNITGHRSYYLIDELVLLEQALIQYAVEKLLQNDFQLFSVPDLLHRDLIESCGMDTRGERTQVPFLSLSSYFC